MTDLTALQSGTVADAQAALPNLTIEELSELREAEAAGSNRTTLLASIDAEIASRDEADDTPEAVLTARQRRDEINRQFEEADEKGKAQIIDETQAGLGVRGY